MRLLKGWKLTLMASMALAGSGGQAWAQKPGSWGSNKPSSPKTLQVTPKGASQLLTPVAYQEPILQDAPIPSGLPPVESVPLGAVPAEGMPMMGPEGYPPGMMGPGMMGPEGYPPGMMGPGMMGPEGCPPGMMGPGMMGPEGCPPGMMGPGMMGPEGCPPGMMGPGMMGPCPECGGPFAGCVRSHVDRWGRNPYGLFAGLGGCLAGLPSLLVPYGEGGIASQRWFDASLEVIGLNRTTGGSNFAVSSLGANSGNFVLGTDMVAPDSMQAGLAAQINVQVGPGSNLEFVYFGLGQDEGSAVARSASANLFSFVSNFGTLPAGGFDDSDRSLIHTLDYRSELHNGEISIRRRWSEPVGYFQGSFLTGVRYLDLDEGSRFTADGLNNNGAANNGPRFFDYDVATRNSLVGWQVGADLWYNFLPGIKMGVEFKTGIYNNRSQQDTSIFANSLPSFGIPEIREYALDNRAAYITQLTPQLVYRLNHSIAFRTSYQVLWIDNVALASDNFNGTPPSLFLPGSNRLAAINNSSDIVYQGITAGVEFTW